MVLLKLSSDEDVGTCLNTFLFPSQVLWNFHDPYIEVGPSCNPHVVNLSRNIKDNQQLFLVYIFEQCYKW